MIIIIFYGFRLQIFLNACDLLTGYTCTPTHTLLCTLKVPEAAALVKGPLVYCGRLHSWLCQTMDHSRLHNFAVLSIENDIAVKLSRAIEIHTIFGDH